MKRIVIEEIGTDSSDDESSTNQSADAPHTSGRATAAAPTSQTRGDCAPATPAQHPTAQTVAEAKAAQATSAQTQQRPAPNRTFSVPRTSTQFLSDWKALQRAPEQRCRYLQVGSSVLATDHVPTTYCTDHVTGDPSIHPSVRPSVLPSICPSVGYPFVPWSIHSCIRPSIHPSVRP